MREILIGFVLCALTALGVFFYMAEQSEQTLSIFEGAEYARASIRAMQAYQHEEPAIALWELRHLADIERELLQKGGGIHGTNGMMMALVDTRSRLAKLYRQIGNETEAQTNAAMAIELLSQVLLTNSSVTNLEGLLQRLNDTDARLKKEPKYE